MKCSLLGTSHNLSWRGEWRRNWGGLQFFLDEIWGAIKMPKDDLGGVFFFLLSSIPTEQNDPLVLKDLILIQFYTKSYIV